jgi:2-keto-4-pentenoate hydratase/2-oxohepta-3-ene-1,7-dioic acid hydratase in catechol pathway
MVVPVPDAAAVLCVGLNYPAHVAEGTFQTPSHPSVFGRWTRSLAVSGTQVRVPAGEDGLDWEGELAAVVGRPMHRVTAEQALDGVLGYAAFNDLTARLTQHRTTQWTLGKNADNSGPIGAIVTADEVGDPAAGLHLTTRVNGQVVQDGSTAAMIFSVGEVLSYLSQVMTLQPGDVVATGTPEGVGYRRTPPWLLGDGDEVTVEIERVGSVTAHIVRPGGSTTPNH